jgi:hypothetical protein
MDDALFVVYLAVLVLLIAALWRVFTKAGKPGWAAIIPIYNAYVLLQIVGRPGWWLILMFIPFVNILIAIMVYLELAQVFGKDTLFGCLMIILPFIFIPVLAFGDAQYQGPLAH